MKILNRRGPRQEPCATPSFKSVAVEIDPLNLTNCCRSEKQLATSCNDDLSKPYNLSFASSNLDSTRSNAFLKSINRYKPMTSNVIHC